MSGSGCTHLVSLGGIGQELMYRIGRAYPSGWDEHGRALHSRWQQQEQHPCS